MADNTNGFKNKPIVVFILGGPGSGKGTQCIRISKEHKFTHISAGDCLREEQMNEDSKYCGLINTCIKEGKIVPAEITILLLKKKMEENGWAANRYLIDGFPRNQDNLDEWNKQMNDKVDVKFCLSLECPEDVLLERLLIRGKDSGRADDNLDSIKKRFLSYQNETKGIIRWFDSIGKLKKVDGSKSIEKVWKELTSYFEVMKF